VLASGLQRRQQAQQQMLAAQQKRSRCCWACSGKLQHCLAGRPPGTKKLGSGAKLGNCSKTAVQVQEAKAHRSCLGLCSGTEARTVKFQWDKAANKKPKKTARQKTAKKQQKKNKQAGLERALRAGRCYESDALLQLLASDSAEL
jgi:hypothetical protein